MTRAIHVLYAIRPRTKIQTERLFRVKIPILKYAIDFKILFNNEHETRTETSTRKHINYNYC